MFTKKYVGGKCAWDHDRTDCAICAKTACSDGFQIKRSTYEFLRNFEFLRNLFLKMENLQKCFGINKNRCFDCKDERICYADQVFQTPDNFWTKTKDGCECKWKVNQQFKFQKLLNDLEKGRWARMCMLLSRRATM